MANGRGKSSVDWETAFAYYASLPPGERSYLAVATHFGVSVRTVETHGRTEQWKERLRAIRKEAAERTADALVDARVDELDKMRRLIDATLIGYAEQLRNGMRMSPADLERLNRLSLALLDEATSPRLAPTPDEHDEPDRSPEHTAAVIAVLEEAGALKALGLTRIPAEDPPTNDEPEPDEPETADEPQTAPTPSDNAPADEPQAPSLNLEGMSHDHLVR